MRTDNCSDALYVAHQDPVFQAPFRVLLRFDANWLLLSCSGFGTEHKIWTEAKDRGLMADEILAANSRRLKHVEELLELDGPKGETEERISPQNCNRIPVGVTLRSMGPLKSYCLL
jgi:hypothetical protein